MYDVLQSCVCVECCPDLACLLPCPENIVELMLFIREKREKNYYHDLVFSTGNF